MTLRVGDSSVTFLPPLDWWEARIGRRRVRSSAVCRTTRRCVEMCRETESRALGLMSKRQGFPRSPGPATSGAAAQQRCFLRGSLPQAVRRPPAGAGRADGAWNAGRDISPSPETVSISVSVPGRPEDDERWSLSADGGLIILSAARYERSM